MKNLLFLISSCFLIFILTRCSNQSDEATDLSKFNVQKLVQDPTYEAYVTEEFNNKKNVIEGNYDMKAIGSIIMPRNQSVCEIPDELFTHIRGGLMYKEIHCKLYNSLVYLNKTYPEFVKTDKQKLLEVYKINHPEYVEKTSLMGLNPRRN